MSPFNALLQEVELLTAQPELKNQKPGCEVRDLLHHRLWNIVSQLNERYSLDLENCCVDLNVEGNRLRIHYWTDTPEQHPATETYLYISQDGTTESEETQIETGDTIF